MSSARIAARYAKSLLELAIEQGKDQEIAADMRLFGQVCKDNRDFQLVLKNPIIKHDKKLNILKAIFEERVEPITMSIFELITRKNREAILPSLAAEFARQHNQKQGIVEASVWTTFELEDDLQGEFRELVEKIAGKKVDLKPIVDPDLIGGFVLRIEDKQIDESLRSKLQHLRLRFKSNEAIKRLTNQ